MAKWIYVVAVVITVTGPFLTRHPAFALTALDGNSVYRTQRFLFGWGAGGSRCGGPGDCPPHHCSRDDAVIHGYCCGCARYNDRVPVPCPGHLQCPLSPEPLCTDYDYMMDCCC